MCMTYRHTRTYNTHNENSILKGVLKAFLSQCLLTHCGDVVAEAEAAVPQTPHCPSKFLLSKAFLVMGK